MKLTRKQYVGQIGENVASRFLEKQGHKVVERNYWKKWGEIDIITLKDKKIYFIEVKTVSRNLSVLYQKDTEYRAEENVHPWKIQRLTRAIESYLAENNVSDETDWQLDLVVVLLDLDNKKAKVEILENIF